jgi:F-type H+-transporting ATPase subunit b
MAILTELGLNGSFFLQLIIFCVAYVALSRLVFGPYSEALTLREQKTIGGENLAAELMNATEDLKTRYETKARLVSGEVKTIFDDYRTQAYKEQEKIVSQARQESNQLMDAIRKKVQIEVSQAQTQMRSEVSLVSQEMIKKLLSK